MYVSQSCSYRNQGGWPHHLQQSHLFSRAQVPGRTKFTQRNARNIGSHQGEGEDLAVKNISSQTCYNQRRLQEASALDHSYHCQDNQIIISLELCFRSPTCDHSQANRQNAQGSEDNARGDHSL